MAIQFAKPVVNSVTHKPAVTHTEPKPVTHKAGNAERQKRWRESHRNEALAKQRERMRRSRGSKLAKVTDAPTETR